jgi:hypothetical protein
MGKASASLGSKQLYYLLERCQHDAHTMTGNGTAGGSVGHAGPLLVIPDVSIVLIVPDGPVLACEDLFATEPDTPTWSYSVLEVTLVGAPTRLIVVIIRLSAGTISTVVTMLVVLIFVIDLQAPTTLVAFFESPCQIEQLSRGGGRVVLIVFFTNELEGLAWRVLGVRLIWRRFYAGSGATRGGGLPWGTSGSRRSALSSSLSFKCFASIATLSCPPV